MSSSLLCGRRNSSDKKKGGDGEQMITGSSSTAAALRKGPWTEEEDEQLVRFVRLLGERRWDFLAKVSGLRRTGKSCRLRWVNYLHPGLRRGRITADEERRIVELHAQWGSRWSRIARSLPGRTDNEIKNFWRTRARKHKAAAAAAAQLEKTAEPASSSSSVTTSTSGAAATTTTSLSGSSSSSSSSLLEDERGSVHDGDDDDAEMIGTPTAAAAATRHGEQPRPEEEDYGCSTTMDQLWNEIAAADAAAMGFLAVDVDDACWGGAGGHPYYYGTAAEPPPASPPWSCGSDFWLWRIDDQEYYKKMLHS